MPPRLLPQKKAIRATKANLAGFEKQRAHLEAVNLERRKDAEVVAAKMDKVSVVITRQAAETGVLYGSVANRDVAESVSALVAPALAKGHQFACGPTGNRTQNPRIKSPLLCQLSYRPARSAPS